VAGFIEAVKLGVDTLELDVVLSREGEVVVSHEAWMNADFCSKPDGEPVTPGEAKKFNLYRMTYEEIRTFDCGKRGNIHFPQQNKMSACKPLLVEVIRAVEDYTRLHDLPAVSYNIELKTEPERDVFNPVAKMYAGTFFKNTGAALPEGRFQLQSFDVELLKAVRHQDSATKIGLLTEDHKSLKEKLSELGFQPWVYSPEFTMVDSRLVKEVHDLGMKLITWTVNEPKDIEKMVNLGVDGIISDYPERVMKIIRTY
jgi:glycerophosphoryl diester phosphodiesterase